jgi:hypothetical protein
VELLLGIHVCSHLRKFLFLLPSGEIFELKEDLNSSDEKKKKDAVKKTIQLMTTGRDASVLFTDVLNCIQTNNLELKKLVYLYVMNYAKTHPDRAILAVNTFKKVQISSLLALDVLLSVICCVLGNYIKHHMSILANYFFYTRHRTLRITTPSSALLPYEPWVASESIKLSNICASLFAAA